MANKNFRVKNGLEIGPSIAITDAGVVTGLTTTNLPQGTNLYHTTALARGSISGGTGISYSSSTGAIAIDSTVATKTYADSAAATAVAAVVDAAPAALDTLNELAAALGDDANFASTVTTAIGTKLATADFNSTADTWLGTKDTDDVAEGTNKYFSTSLARSSISAGTGISYSSTTGVIDSTITQYTDALARAAVDNNVDLDTDGAGTYVKSIRDQTYVLGELTATRNTSYIDPLANSNEVSGTNGFEAVSSVADAAGPKGYTAGFTATYYHGETSAGNTIAPGFTLRAASGTNAGGGAAVPINTVMGSFNFNGHSGTDFASYVGTQNGGGGRTVLVPLQLQGFATQAFGESTSTLATTVGTQSNLSLTTVVSSGSGVFTNTSADVRQYDVIRVTGTLTGTMTFPGYVSGNLYYVTAGASPTTTFTIAAEHDGTPIATTAGTTTGLLFQRCRSLLTFATQTYTPFGPSSKVTVAGIAPSGFNGTYRAVFGTTTQVGYGNYHPSGSQTVAGTVSIYNVTAGGVGFRVRGYGDNVPYNSATRINFINHTPAAATYRSDAFTFQRAASTALLPGGDISYRRTFGCFHKMATVTAAAADTIYAFDWTASTTAHVNTQGVTVANTSQIVFDNAGDYNVFVEMVAKNTDTQDRTAYIWLRKNGVDQAETTIKLVLTKDTSTMLAKLWLVNGITDNQYVEIMFAVDNPSGISLEYTAPATTPYARPAVAAATVTITPVGA